MQIQPALALAALILVVLAVVSIIGRLVLAILRVPRSLTPVAPAAGLAVIIGVAWPLQYAGVSMRSIAAVTVLLAIASACAPLVSPRLKARTGSLLTISFADAWGLAIALITTTAFMWPALRDYGLTLVSMGNADPVSYALDARQTLDSGYLPSAGVLNRDLNFDASWNWAGAVTVQALVSGITGRAPGLSSLLTVGMLMVLGQWQTTVLVRRLAPFTGAAGRWRRIAPAVIAPFAAAIAWLNPFVGYIGGSGFLAQLTTMALLPAIVLVLLQAKEPSGGNALAVAALGGILTGAALATFAAVAPVVIIILLLGWVLWLATSGRMQTIRKLWAPTVVAGAFALTTGIAGVLWFSINGVLVTTASTAGWPMSPPSLLTVIGLRSFLDDAGMTSVPFGLIGVVGAVAILIIVAANLLQRSALASFRLAIGLAIIVMMALSGILFGLDAYKNWKLWGMLTPLLVAVLAASIIAVVTARTPARWRSLIVGCMAVAAIALSVLSVWRSGKEWRQSAYAYGATPNHVALLSDPTLRNARGINVAGTGTTDTLMLLLYAGTDTRVSITESFYPAMPPAFPWTLTGTTGAPVTGSKTLNDAYRLVPRD